MPKRKYELNTSFFKKITKESAWVLGWLATDGYINEKEGRIVLGITDKEIVEKIKNLISPAARIYESKAKGRNHKIIYIFKITSREMVNDCVNLGINQKKSLTLRLPNIPIQYLYDFLRGAIEGDGTISLRYRPWKDLSVSIVSASFMFIDELKNKFNNSNKIGIDNTYSNPTYRISWYGKFAVSLLDKVYEDCSDLKLNRKYKIYKNYKENLGE